MNSSQSKLPPFDELIALAHHSPAAFEKLKKELCEEAIVSSSSKMQPRLRAQQSHIDRLIARGKNPYHTMVTLMQELYAQVERLQCALRAENMQSNTAEVIALYPDKK